MHRRWSSILVLLCLMGCSRAPAIESNAPRLLPMGPIVGPLLTPPDPSTSSVKPEVAKRLGFAYPPGPDAQLFLYDDTQKDVWVFPGAGEGIENVYELNPGQYCFDDKRTIFVYDEQQERLIHPIDTCRVVEYAFVPTYDGNYNLYFIGTNDPSEAEEGVGTLYGAFTPFGKSAPATSSLGLPCTILELPKVNEIREGGVNSVCITSEGSLLGFTTACGGLYLYTPFQPALWKLPIGPLRASQSTIDPIWGRFIAWKEPDQKRIYLLDRWTDCIDPVPFANQAENLVDVTMLGFQDSDPWHLFYFATIRGEASPTRLLCYDIRDESVRTLSILNMVPNAFRCAHFTKF